jgi:hypothetical protein
MVRRPQSAGPPRHKGHPFPETLYVDDVEVVPLQRANEFVFLAAQNA